MTNQDIKDLDLWTLLGTGEIVTIMGQRCTIVPYATWMEIVRRLAVHEQNIS
jgi:hypothetical protein